MSLKRRSYEEDVDNDDDDVFDLGDDDDVNNVHHNDNGDVSASPLLSVQPSSSVGAPSHRYEYSTFQSFALASSVIQHPRDSNIRWTADRLVEMNIHDAMKTWFTNNVVNYMKNRKAWPSRVSPKRFLLNFGQSGSGRTTALVTLCAEHAVNIIAVRENVSTPSYIQDAYAKAKINQPCVVYFEQDRRITSSDKSAQIFRNNVYTAYTNSMNVCDDEVWTVIATGNPPQNLMNGSSRYSQFFMTHGDAVYTPVLTSRTTIRTIITHIFMSYTGSDMFLRPNSEWAETIDRLTTCAIYHTIREIYTFIDGMFREFMYSHARPSDAVYKHDAFTGRMNALPSVKTLDCLSQWRKPRDEYHQAERQWQAYERSHSSVDPTTKSNDHYHEDVRYLPPSISSSASSSSASSSSSLPPLPSFERYHEIQRNAQKRQRGPRYPEYDPQMPSSRNDDHIIRSPSPQRAYKHGTYSQPQSVSQHRPPKAPMSSTSMHFLETSGHMNGRVHRPAIF